MVQHMTVPAGATQSGTQASRVLLGKLYEIFNSLSRKQWQRDECSSSSLSDGRRGTKAVSSSLKSLFQFVSLLYPKLAQR